MPSFILICPTVWPQYTDVTDRTGQDRQDNGPIALGEPFYKRSLKNGSPYAIGPLSVCLSLCLSVLSCPVLSVCLTVTLVYCGQTVGSIKMKLGMPVGLRPGHIVLHGDPAPPPQKGGRVPSPLFSPCLLWPNGWMDQDTTWYGGRPWPRPHCARWGSSSP